MTSRARSSADYGASLGAGLLAAALLCAPMAARAQDVPPVSAVNPVDDLIAVGPPLSAEENAALERALSVDPSQLSGNAAGKVRTPGLPQPEGFEINGTDRPDGSGTVTVKRPLSTEWNANVGADFSLAAPPPDLYQPVRPLPAQAYSGDASGAAWASVGVVKNLATVDARLDGGSDLGQFGTTLQHSVPLGSRFSVTLRDRYAVSESFAVPSANPVALPVAAPPAGAVMPEAIWSNQKEVKFDVLATGTTLAAGIASSNIDPVVHRTLRADQKLYGPLHLTTAVTDVGQPTANKSVGAALKFNW